MPVGAAPWCDLTALSAASATTDAPARVPGRCNLLRRGGIIWCRGSARKAGGLRTAQGPPDYALTRRDISHDGAPDTGRNRIPSNTECIWGNDPLTAPQARAILIALQFFTTDSSATGSYQAHQYLVITSAAAQPVSGLGQEAMIVSATRPDHWSEAAVTFRGGNAVAVIRYSGLDRSGATQTAFSIGVASRVALELARDVLAELPGA